MKDTSKKVGDVLDNGYTIVLTNNSTRVLGHKASKEEYATWMFTPNCNTQHGHYYTYWDNYNQEDALADAIEDYKRR